MAVQKNFVVHNGLEVNQNLILANSFTNKVGILTNSPNYTLHVNGGIGATDLKVSGISTFNDIFLDGSVSIGETTGLFGQYLTSTGIGLTWSSIPNARAVASQTAVSGQITFNVSYNIGFIDVYINGIRLSESEFVAVDGISVSLDTACFGGESVDFITYKASTGTGINGITVKGNDVIVGSALSTIILNFAGSGVNIEGAGVAATITIPSYWTYENFAINTIQNVGIGTTNPKYSLDVGGTIRTKGFIESQNTSSIANNILSLDATQGTVFTHTTSANIGIVSFTGISTNSTSTQTFTVLVTQGDVGYNTTAATGIGTQLATVVTEGGVGYSTHIKVGGGTTMTLTNTTGALDILTFIVSYNGNVSISNTSFTVIGMAATNFKGVI